VYFLGSEVETVVYQGCLSKIFWRLKNPYIFSSSRVSRELLIARSRPCQKNRKQPTIYRFIVRV